MEFGIINKNKALSRTFSHIFDFVRSIICCNKLLPFPQVALCYCKNRRICRNSFIFSLFLSVDLKPSFTLNGLSCLGLALPHWSISFSWTNRISTRFRGSGLEDKTVQRLQWCFCALTDIKLQGQKNTCFLEAPSCHFFLNPHIVGFFSSIMIDCTAKSTQKHYQSIDTGPPGLRADTKRQHPNVGKV